MLNVLMAKTIDVNQTSILVSDTVANDSLKLKQAFAQIVANSTGENIIDILSNSVFNSTNIKNGVKRSYFEKIDSKYVQNKQHKFWFHLVMDGDFVQNIIQQAGFSLLPHNREKIMLWVVKESTRTIDFEEGKTVADTVLSFAYDDELTMYWVNHWAKALGLMLQFPNMDEQDKLLVTPDSIQSLSYQAIDQSNNRYKSEQSLLIYIKDSTQSIKIRSGLTLKESGMIIKHYQGQSNTENIAEEGEILYSVLFDVALQYGELHKINRDDLENHTVRMHIQEIESYQQVNWVRKYLTSLSVIDSYDVVSASKGELVLNVSMSVNTSAFLQLVAREKRLIYNNNSPLNQLFFSLVKINPEE